MKRIKIMLLSLTVLAVVGGALAFKAKDDNFCIYKIVGTTCPSIAIAETATTAPAGIFFTLPRAGCPTVVNSLKCTLDVVYLVD